MNAFAKPPLPTASRNAGIDALRASLTLLVVFHHAAIAYGGMGSWFYKEIEPSSAPSSLILTLFVAYNQAFFMGLFFLIAGSLTPGAIARHGAAGFFASASSRSARRSSPSSSRSAPSPWPWRRRFTDIPSWRRSAGSSATARSFRDRCGS